MFKMMVLESVCADGVENRVSSVEANGTADMGELVVPVRRSSARVKKLIDEKGKKSLADHSDSDLKKPIKKRVNLKRKLDVGAGSSEAKKVELELEVEREREPEVVLNNASAGANLRSELIHRLPHMRNDDSGDCGDNVENGTESGVVAENGVEKSDFAVAKDTLRKFNKYYLHFIQVNLSLCFFIPK